MVKLHVAITAEMQEKLKKFAKNKKVSVPQLVRDLVDKYLISDDEAIPVILKIPAKYRADKPVLRRWLEIKSEAIVEALNKE